MEDKRFEDQLKFILEVDKEKNIFRQTHLVGYSRRENDAEHAWHLATMAYLLKEYSNEEIDLAKAMMMALIHDVVEIDAGDTYAYDEAGLVSQKEREEKAAERIFGLLPEDQAKELRALFEEFEAYESPEARFVRALDNIQPMLLNDANDGKDWLDRKITKTQVYKRHTKTATGSKKLWDHTEKMIERNIAEGKILDQ